MIGKGFERLLEIISEIEKDAPSARQYLSAFLARAVNDEVLPPSFLADSVVCSVGGDIVDNAKLLLSRDHAGAKLERIWGPGDGRPVHELKVVIDQVFQEFLISSDVEDACRCFVELNVPLFFHEVVKRGVINSLDSPSSKQEEISNLFAALHRREIMSTQQARKGFDRLRSMLPDLVLDTPNAASLIDAFEVRARANGVLPPL
jgi:programmed cell death protein 4